MDPCHANDSRRQHSTDACASFALAYASPRRSLVKVTAKEATGRSSAGAGNEFQPLPTEV